MVFQVKFCPFHCKLDRILIVPLYSRFHSSCSTVYQITFSLFYGTQISFCLLNGTSSNILLISLYSRSHSACSALHQVKFCLFHGASSTIHPIAFWLFHCTLGRKLFVPWYFRLFFHDPNNIML